MTATKGSDNRVVLPRWRIWKENQVTGESQPLKNSRLIESEAIRISAQAEFQQLADGFKESRGIYEAADVVSAAIVLGLEQSEDARDAARVLYDSHLPIGRQFAEQILLQSSSADTFPEFRSELALAAERSTQEDRERIARLRRIVRRQPRSALQWLDLALAHTVLGNLRQAQKAINVAMALSDNNRLVIRASARFFVHTGDLDAARAVLSSDLDRLLSDPWLLAADIAIAELANQPVKYANRGKRMLEGGLAPRHLSELAAALATIELEHGRAKQARKYFARALEDPTDNALAQAEWAVSLGIQIRPPDITPPLNFEAESRHALREGNFDIAATQSRLWQEDERIALFPARHSSYISAALSDDNYSAMLACMKGLKTNPNDHVLLNNLAFAQASANLVDRAERTIKRLAGVKVGVTDQRNLLVWTATRGLLAFRQGRPVDGRKLYQESIAGWRRNGTEQANAARASIFWAREEILGNTEYVSMALEAMEAACRTLSTNPEIQVLRDRIRRLRNSASG
jgi:tetratricopeptide (TPR) repeat protein